MNGGITLGDIWRQALADLFAKEVQTTPTYSYQWLACQMGHIGLGLLVLLFAARIVGADVNASTFWCFAAVLLFAAVKELYDWRDTKRQMRSRFDAELDTRDVVADAAIATFYMAWGAAFGFGVLERCSAFWIIPWLIAALILVPGAMRTRMNFQQSDLPFLFRLPEFRDPCSGSALSELINRYVSGVSRDAVRHLTIIGTLGSGKTSLAVGIGTESAFAGRRVRYLTCTKLRQLGAHPDPDTPRNVNVWPWTSCRLVIVDDVVAAKSNSQDVPLPQSLATLLRQRCTVWVLDDDSANAAGWRCHIAAFLGVEPVEVDSVILAPTAAERARITPAHAGAPGSVAVASILR